MGWGNLELDNLLELHVNVLSEVPQIARVNVKAVPRSECRGSAPPTCEARGSVPDVSTAGSHR